MKKNIFIIFIVSILVSFGCSSETENTNTNIAVNTAANAPANSVAETEPEIDLNAPFVPSENPKDDLINAMKRLQATDSRTATLVNDAMPDMKSELQYIKPDRFRVKNPSIELIAIGNDTYVKQNGKWLKSDENFSAQLNEMKKNFNADAMSAVNDIKKSDGEKINGKDTILYVYNVEPTENTIESSTKVWVAKDNGLPLKIVVNTKNAGQKQTITTDYDYSKQVKIEAPEVQENPEN